MNETAYTLVTWALVVFAMALILAEHFVKNLDKDTYKEHSDYTIRDFYSITKKD